MILFYLNYGKILIIVHKRPVKYQFSIKVIFILYKVMENKFKKNIYFLYIIKVQIYNEKYNQFIKKIKRTIPYKYKIIFFSFFISTH